MNTKKFLKKVYCLIPLKQSFLTILKRFYTPSRNVYQHLHFEGNFKVEVTREIEFCIKHYGLVVENEIFWSGIFGGWEKYSLMIWADLCRQAKVVFDIGANTGVYSLLAKAVNNDAEVFAFEPVERVFKKLKNNITLNKFDVHSINKAVSNSNGKAIIYDKNTKHTYSVTVNKDLSEDRASSVEVEIDTVTLDHFIQNEDLDQVDLLKIDVETHEAEVLMGFQKSLARSRPSFIIEILNNEIAEKIEMLVKGMSYEFYNINETTGITKVSKLSKSDSYNYLICQHSIAQKLKDRNPHIFSN
ncbi:MAG: FkbM family methyltransferase [Cyclobacteriaceae bacterium]